MNSPLVRKYLPILFFLLNRFPPRNRQDGPKTSEPSVSIVIPTVKNFHLTSRCVQKVSEEASTSRFEVIVVEDSRSLMTFLLLKLNRRIRVVRTPTNLGLGGACDAGIKFARAKLVILLNNDTEVHDWWRDNLARNLSDSSVGAIGSKIIRNHLDPYLGDKGVLELATGDLNSLYGLLLGKGRKDSKHPGGSL